MGRRTKNALALGALATLAGLAALGLWWILHKAAADMGSEVGPGGGFEGLERAQSDAPSGIRLRGTTTDDEP
ncbi:MAG: hypothetical protein ACYSWX_11025 [Planctomycetota bacterium]|jgi:hypothetical protein